MAESNEHEGMSLWLATLIVFIPGFGIITIAPKYSIKAKIYSIGWCILFITLFLQVPSKAYVIVNIILGVFIFTTYFLWRIKEEYIKRKTKFSIKVSLLPSIYQEVNVLVSGINYTGKAIKYIHLWVKAYNPVGDVERKPELLTIVGPIINKTDISVQFDDLWYSKVITSVKIISCFIEFIDGNSLEHTTL